MAATDPTNFTREQIEALGGVISGNVGKAKVLTTADYNYPTTGTKTSVALWLLEPGLYYRADTSVSITMASGYNSGPSLGSGDSYKSFLVYKAGSDRKNAIVIPDSTISENTRAAFLNYTNSYGVASVYNIITSNNLVDNLTTNSTATALTAKQGKVLKDLSDSLAIRGAGAPTTSTVGQVGTLYEDTTNGKLYICTAIVPGTDPDPDTYTWTEVGAGGGGPTVVQTTGTSTTDVMSQNAVTSMVYKDPATKYDVQIGASAVANGSNYCDVAIGWAAKAAGINAVAIGAKAGSATTQPNYTVNLGSFSNATEKGQCDISTLATTNDYGYNNSQYRLLTGLYDPQSDHDAATKGYVDPTTDSSAPTTATVGRLGQIQIDTTTATAYMCVAVDTVTPAYTWKQITA